VSALSAPFLLLSAFRATGKKDKAFTDDDLILAAVAK
jgi:hypothetical protein